MGMSERLRYVVGLTGFHGTELREVALWLESRDYQIIWPGQDLDVIAYEAHGQTLYERHRENIEVLRLNEEMLGENGMRWFDARPEPLRAVLSPATLLAKFRPDRHVLLVDPRLCLTLTAYSGLLTHVLYLPCERPATVAAALQRAWGLDEEHWLEQHAVYEQAFLQQRIKHHRLGAGTARDPVRLAAQLQPLLAN